MPSNLFNRDPAVQSADYKSAGSHQIEVLSHLEITSINVYETLYTVPVGKTLFVSSLLGENGVNMTYHFATGGAGVEADFFRVLVNNSTEFLSFDTPIKISGGTRVSARNNNVQDGSVSLIGWVE